jgi:hypothetical protein
VEMQEATSSQVEEEEEEKCWDWDQRANDSQGEPLPWL